MPYDLDRHSAFWRYGLAVLTVAAALLVTLASREFGLTNRSAAFLAAILLTGWYAGIGPLIAAMVLSTFVYDYFFLPPLYTLGIEPGPYLVWFLAFALLAGWFSTARRRSARLLEEARSDLEEKVVARTAELRRSEAFLAVGQEMSHTGSWTRRMSTGEGYWSDETFRIFGLDPTRPAPTLQQLLRLCHPDDRDLLDQALNASAREGRKFELEYRIIRPDGSMRYVYSKGQPVLDEAGGVVEIRGVLMDVTEWKRAERAVRRARERTLEARFSAILAERTRLAREIHDTLLQGFTGVGLKLVAVANRVTGQPETAGALKEVLALAQKTLEDARRAVWDMRSPSLAGAEFSVALRKVAEDATRGSDLAVRYEERGFARPVDPTAEEVAFRIVQEAIANAVRHAAAQTLRVRCRYGTHRLRLSVRDDGRGFIVDPDFRAYGGHWGLLGMRERANQVGARLLVRSSPGQGTEVILLIPYAAGQTPPEAEA
jgi:PAS domain S-box-containing protein